MAKKCQLGPVLSYGSEGTVHSGTWCNRSAAIKVLLNHHARRVETEMQVVKNLNHINIIKYFDLEYERTIAYLSMEYITGGNLYGFIQNKFTSSIYWPTICHILIDVARGMGYLHDHYIVQSDLKSHNILLRENTYQAVICDFGISRSLENESPQKTRSNSAKGTIRWMAPEICTPPPEPSSYKSDVWSYGCIILEITSGRDPWIDQFEDDAMLFRALQRKENALIFARICTNQHGPSYACDLLTQCCAWSKINRPQFVDILTRLESERSDDIFIDTSEDRMSISRPVSNDRSDFEEDHTESDEKWILDDDETAKIQIDHSFQVQEFVDTSKRVFTKSNKHQGRLTGELFTSAGSASGRPIYEGVKGGRYYLAASGSKVYLRK